MKNFLNKAWIAIKAMFLVALERVAPRRDFVPRMYVKQGGFVLLGSRGYNGYLPNTIVELQASTEASLIASGQATDSAGPPTSGAVSTTETSGCVTIAAGASSLVITNPLISKQSKVFAVVAQAAADATLLRVERVVCANGSVTIYGTANATAATMVDWALMSEGSMSAPK